MGVRFLLHLANGLDDGLRSRNRFSRVSCYAAVVGRGGWLLANDHDYVPDQQPPPAPIYNDCAGHADRTAVGSVDETLRDESGKRLPAETSKHKMVHPCTGVVIVYCTQDRDRFPARVRDHRAAHVEGRVHRPIDKGGAGSVIKFNDCLPTHTVQRTSVAPKVKCP